MVDALKSGQLGGYAGMHITCHGSRLPGLWSCVSIVLSISVTCIRNGETFCNLPFMYSFAAMMSALEYSAVLPSRAQTRNSRQQSRSAPHLMQFKQVSELCFIVLLASSNVRFSTRTRACTCAPTQPRHILYPILSISQLKLCTSRLASRLACKHPCNGSA